LPGTYLLPERLRPVLAKPLGRLFTPAQLKEDNLRETLSAAKVVVSVGDRVTETVASLGRIPDVQVVDAKENRKGRELPEVPFVRLVKVSNPPGSLTGQAIEGIKEAFSGGKPVRVLVDGEEDLMAIPVIALAPLSSLVVYGQPGEGVVLVTVDGATKGRNHKVLAEMGVPESVLAGSS